MLVAMHRKARLCTFHILTSNDKVKAILVNIFGGHRNAT
ncbi:unnamed protein product [Musa acuminata subsp. malaccensis]|uniref:(wild Malaysian banana) hypothetical protein n=1 Tax=Musa acuminata subsp. malaccensis TaxID=214687 RepID=A0A804LA60_MUSAM|nr:unnamed protein product [Musa acuminata subsp. malaccensis]